MAGDCGSIAVCYWGLDCTFWIHRKVFIRTIFELKQSRSYKGFYEFHGRIISKVEVHGIIASVDEREKLITYKVDDGTGIIACCCWRETIKESFVLGQSVAVQGKIAEYRGEKQLSVNFISLEDDLNAECLFWLDVINLSKNFYNIPFILPESMLHCEETTNTSVSLLDVIQRSNLGDKSSFTFAELCSVNEAKGLKKSTENSDDRKDRIDEQPSENQNRCLRDMLCHLEKQGEVFYKDPKKDIYEIITHDKHLKPAIVKAIKKISKGSPHDGAHISRITDIVHSSQYLGRVPCTKIMESLKKLVENSEVYQKNDQVYCLV